MNSDVDVQALVTPPTNVEQEEVFGEALQVFKELDAQVHAFDRADEVGRRAAELLTLN